MSANLISLFVFQGTRMRSLFGDPDFGQKVYDCLAFNLEFAR
jgi:hypothetical protein